MISLNDLLDDAANPFSGWLLDFLASIEYDDRAHATLALDRVTEMLHECCQGQLPSSFTSEVRERADGRFDFRAQLIDERGEVYQIGNSMGA
jgi:hypothetical protein